DLDGCDVKAALSLYRLQDDRSNIRRLHIRVKQAIQRLETRLNRDAEMGSRKRHSVDLRRGRTPVLFIRNHLSGEGRGQQRSAMKGAVECNNRISTACNARDLD